MIKVKPAIVALSETRVTAEIGECEVCMPGYSIVRCDAESRNTGGGAILYVRNDINYEILKISKIESNCWSAAIEVNDKIFKGVIMVVYHSPSSSDGEFIRFLEDVTEELTVKGECLIIGDFNIDIMKDSFYKEKLLTEMRSLGMNQYVNDMTRVMRDSQTTIDLVFANMRVQLRVEHEPKITDHAWIKMDVGITRKTTGYREVETRNYSKIDINDFKRALISNVHQRQNMELDLKAKLFVDNIVVTLNRFAPTRISKIPSVWDGKKWYSSEIQDAADRRDRAYRAALSDDTADTWSQYKMERNRVVKLIREKKKNYYENMIDNNKGDAAKMWKTLKEVIKGEVRSVKKIENIDFEILNDAMGGSISDKFNEYYVQSISDIVASIQQDTTGSPNRRRILTGIEMNNDRIMENFNHVEIEELGKIVMGLPKKKGTEEGISSDILQMAFDAIKEEFLEIINESLREGCCPNSWKTSTIIPIPKINKATKASQYRPINMLPLYEKVLELVVKNQIEKHLDEYDIIMEHQSGFRKRHSCETAIQTVIDEWKVKISERKIVGVIFMDLKRAFEMVDRKIVLDKLYQYGIRGRVLDWFRTYLSNRTQKVRFNDTWSEVIGNEYGVPQGSVLGPLLFIIYINDIVNLCPEGCSIKMFADDTVIYVTGLGSAEVEDKMNRSLSIVEQWMNRNKLKMNAEKTKYMIVSSIRKTVSGNTVLKCLDGTVLERVEKMKYLRIIIDEKLRFTDHCEYMLKKIGKKTSFLNRMGHYVSAYTRCTIYKAIIAPHFEYCATLLLNMGETELNNLQIAQNRAMRVILQCNRYTKVEDMLKAVQFMSVRQRLYYNVCIFIFKSVNNLMPKEFKNRLQIVASRSGRETCQAQSIIIPFRKTKSAQKSMYYEGVKMYNALPTEIKGYEQVEQFKRGLKAYIAATIK